MFISPGPLNPQVSSPVLPHVHDFVARFSVVVARLSVVGARLFVVVARISVVVARFFGVDVTRLLSFELRRVSSYS